MFAATTEGFMRLLPAGIVVLERTIDLLGCCCCNKDTPILGEVALSTGIVVDRRMVFGELEDVGIGVVVVFCGCRMDCVDMLMGITKL